MAKVRSPRQPEQLSLFSSPATNLSMACSMPAPAVAVAGDTPFRCQLAAPCGYWTVHGQVLAPRALDFERRA